MNNMRKIAVAAVAGATASSFVSLHVKIIDRLLYHPRRRKRIAELREWYDAELRDIEQYAEEKSVLFVEAYRDRFLATIADEEHSEAVINGSLAALRISVHGLIRLKQQAWLTREYSIRLSKLNTDLAHEQKQEAADLMASEVESADRMRIAEYPVNELYAWLLRHKRV